MDTKVKLRKCVSCGEMKEKKELLRVVRDKDGTVAIDPTFKKDGRGAYVCKTSLCILNAGKKRAFNRALKCNVDESIYEKLLEQTQE